MRTILWGFWIPGNREKYREYHHLGWFVAAINPDLRMYYAKSNNIKSESKQGTIRESVENRSRLLWCGRITVDGNSYRVPAGSTILNLRLSKAKVTVARDK